MPNKTNQAVKWEERFYEEKCCDKCHDIYFDKTYPAHTSYDACINSSCECHIKNKQSWEKEFEKVWNKFISEIENGNDDGLYLMDRSLIKSFIRQTIKEEKDAVLDKLMVEFTTWFKAGTEDVEYFMDRVIKKLKK